MVALRKESVDRNKGDQLQGGRNSQVALRKESVDRNMGASYGRTAKMVALRKESVDRNLMSSKATRISVMSLSARRAWIEITIMNTANDKSKRRSPQGERG